MNLPNFSRRSPVGWSCSSYTSTTTPTRAAGQRFSHASKYPRDVTSVDVHILDVLLKVASRFKVFSAMFALERTVRSVNASLMFFPSKPGSQLLVALFTLNFLSFDQ